MTQSFPVKSPHRYSAGFSMIELLVTISIVIAVTGIAMVRYSTFNDGILLYNQAYELALDVRQSQVFGLSIRADAIGSAANRVPIGVYFAEGDQDYTLFRDLNEDGEYNASTDTELGVYEMDSRFSIVDICHIETAGDTPDCDAGWATVSFQRPNYQALLETSEAPAGDLFELQLQLNTAAGASPRTVVVRRNGQIKVE